MKKKSNKLICLVFLLVFMFILYIYIRNKPYNYEKTYSINKFNISEEYRVSNKEYFFVVKYKKIQFPYLINSKYSKKRKLIKDVLFKKNDDEICILPKSNIIDFYPLCYKGSELYSYNNSEIKIDYKYKKYNSESDSYKNINIYTFLNNNYLLYNYKGFYLINNNIKKNINLFKKDIYKIELVYQKDNYLLLPDYNQNYYFNKLYSININNGNVLEIESSYNISYNSRFIMDNNKIIIEDKKEDKYYYVDINKKIIEEVSDYEDKDILNDSKYKIKNNKLYKCFDNYNIKISNMDISSIVKEGNDFVYFISKDTLYAYNDYYGIIKIMSNFEWNFNNTNMVFIY